MATTSIGASSRAQVYPENLGNLLYDELEKCVQKLAGPLSLVPLNENKDCADATTKVIVSPHQGEPAAVFICSKESAPDLIRRSMDLAESVRSVIGETLGEAIVRPIATGYLDGCSYMLLPFLPDFSKFKPARIAQLFLIRRPLLDWLQQANAVAAEKYGCNAETTARYAKVLKHLRDQRLFGSAMQGAIEEALARLDAGRWQPRHSFDHNDLWLGNVMLAPKSVAAGPNRYPFVLIDWPGANARGYGIYDLIRIAPDLKLSAVALKRELIGHSEALHCELEDTRGHLLAALGRLHIHLENFPEQLYVSLAETCWATLESALESRSRSG